MIVVVLPVVQEINKVFKEKKSQLWTGENDTKTEPNLLENGENISVFV